MKENFKNNLEFGSEKEIMTKADILNIMDKYFTKLSKNNITYDIMLTKPKKWEYMPNCFENYTGIIKENEREQLIPLMATISTNTHEHRIQNSELIQSINALQETPYRRNEEVYNWIFSKENPEYIDKEEYEILRKDYKGEMQKRPKTEEVKNTITLLSKNLSKFYDMHLYEKSFKKIFTVFNEAVSELQEAFGEKLLFNYGITANEIFPEKECIFYFPLGKCFDGRNRATRRKKMTGNE